jgi:hypothetical protein
MDSRLRGNDINSVRAIVAAQAGMALLTALWLRQLPSFPRAFVPSLPHKPE